MHSATDVPKNQGARRLALPGPSSHQQPRDHLLCSSSAEPDVQVPLHAGLSIYRQFETPLLQRRLGLSSEPQLGLDRWSFRPGCWGLRRQLEEDVVRVHVQPQEGRIRQGVGLHLA